MDSRNIAFSGWVRGCWLWTTAPDVAIEAISRIAAGHLVLSCLGSGSAQDGYLAVARHKRRWQMSRTRPILLGMAAALSAVGVMASSASAISFQWNVSGKKLETGQSREFTISADGKFSFELKIAGSAGLLLSSELSVLKGAKIIGGVPGTNEETFVFKGVTVDKPANCGLLQTATAPGVVQTTLLKTEIVEGTNGEGKGNGTVDILFTPKTTGTEIFATFELAGTSCLFKGTIAPITGLLLALSLPERAESATGALDFEASTSKQYLTSAGTLGKALFALAGEDASLLGLALVSLTTGEKFGAF
jgi:hypothetical protein